jgi:hypothetical protein
MSMGSRPRKEHKVVAPRKADGAVRVQCGYQSMCGWRGLASAWPGHLERTHSIVMQKG